MMQFFRRFTLLAIASAAFSAHAELTPEQIKSLPPSATHPIDFARDIKPILETSCLQCHGRSRDKGGFRVDTRELLLKGGDSGPAIVTGDSAKSYLIELVAGIDPDFIMPEKGEPLTKQQISLLRGWIDQGVKWPADINFVRTKAANLTPRKPELPPVRHSKNPVDRFIDSYLVENNIPRPKLATEAIYARRVYLDTVGLLPPPEEWRQYVMAKAPNKRGDLIDRLLADKHNYAQHWLTFWNDLLRNDYKGTGFIDKGRSQISGWLYASLVNNKPYDQFVRELINPNEASAGFTKGIVWRGVVNASQTPQMQAAQNISQVFMGVNLKCASCHDSFINDWRLADAYGLASIYAEGPLEMVQCDKPTGKTAPVQFIYPQLGKVNPKAAKPERLKQLAKIISSQKNGRLSRTIVNRLWARLMGRGLVEPLDDMEQKAWHPALLDWLAEDLVEHGYDLKRTLRVIMSSDAYAFQAANLNPKDQAAYAFRGPAVRRMTAEQFRDALATLTSIGYESPVAPVNLKLGTKPDGKSNPFTTEPKWIWNTPKAMSAKPGAAFFRTVFELDSTPEKAAVVISADNSYDLYVNGQRVVRGSAWNKPDFANIRKQLKVGENVIAALARNGGSGPNAAGLLVYARIETGGEVREIITDGTWKTGRRTNGWESAGFDDSTWKPASEIGEMNMKPWTLRAGMASALARGDNHGRVRASLVTADPLTRALGRPNREQVVTVRDSAATTLQALELTNGDTLADILSRGSQRLASGKNLSTNALVIQLYQTALSRAPKREEQELARKVVGAKVSQEGVSDLLWALAMHPEFQLIY